MVKKGQTIVEFLIILVALTAIGFLVARIWPSLTSVQTNVASTISKD
jgi:hypothetical protein